MFRPTALLALLGACSFTPGQLRGDAAGSGGGSDAPMIDAPMIDMMVPIDGPPDMAVSLAKVRSIDLVDGLVSAGPHVDFPLLVYLPDMPWLRSTANGGEVARADGFDIYFSADQLGVTRLVHEVERYDPVAGFLVAWVKVPALASTTVLYMHYGDTSITTSQEAPAMVWTAGFELVAHMDGGPDPAGKNTLTESAVAAATSIGPARSFNSDTSNVNAGSMAAIDNVFNGGGSVEVWFFADTFGEGGFGRIFDKGNSAGFAIHLDDTNANDAVGVWAGCTTGNGIAYWSTNAIPNVVNAWHHVVINWDSSAATNAPSFYIDGNSFGSAEVDACSGSIVSDAAADLDLGNNGVAGTRSFDGVLDELRISSVVRSAGWILTQFRNHNDPQAFYTVSAPL